MQNSDTNSSVRVLAFLKSKEGKRQELLDLLLPHVEPSRKEEGNISYVLSSSIENPNEFLFDEVWSNKQTSDKHYNKPDSYRIRQEVTDLLAEPLGIKTYVEIKEN